MGFPGEKERGQTGPGNGSQIYSVTNLHCLAAVPRGALAGLATHCIYRHRTSAPPFQPHKISGLEDRVCESRMPPAFKRPQTAKTGSRTWMGKS